ncbi:histone chaperone ASF1A isoform X1 [Columba livia]|uniref:histone chaperone ASF1A isoform X1 n=1 Tax=Columba livia TaxID=8932 RepID=UPI0031BAB66C
MLPALCVRGGERERERVNRARLPRIPAGSGAAAPGRYSLRGKRSGASASLASRSILILNFNFIYDFFLNRCGRQGRAGSPPVAGSWLPRRGGCAGPAARHDLEWKIIYVGSAESEEYDQVLDSVLVGPVPAGRHMFVFQADAPNPGLIPDADAVGVTVVLITCTYRGQEFIRVGYYVNNEYTETELRENPPVKPDFSKLQRNILASNPRVTRFHINWEDNTEKLEDAESSNPNLQSLLSTDALPSASKGWSTSENSLNVMLESHMDCM